MQQDETIIMRLPLKIADMEKPENSNRDNNEKEV
ncbi:hypothetical protein S1OALGB6SA_633 [Olavius algarvensis spirochete endosymbiont]|nr:hypothetical protein S1OALGB6SA_633 [Olavius algarvensis spirochete endosymbiont]